MHFCLCIVHVVPGSSFKSVRDDAHTAVPFPTTLVADLAIVVIIVVVAVVIICVVRRQRGLHTFSKLYYATLFYVSNFPLPTTGG